MRPMRSDWREGTAGEVRSAGSSWRLAGERWLSGGDGGKRGTGEEQMTQVEGLGGNALDEQRELVIDGGVLGEGRKGTY